VGDVTITTHVSTNVEVNGAAGMSYTNLITNGRESAKATFGHHGNGRMRIFLAENHIIMRGGLRILLQSRSDFHICGEADDGREAVELVLKTRPHVVVTNINLPGVNGIEATRQIHEALPTVGVLIFTAENNERLMRAALHAGACGYLLKSASDKQVIDAIEATARHERYVSSAVAEKLLDDVTGQNNPEQLTAREGDIVRLIAQGYRGREIALMLGISVKTVDCHRSAAMGKLQLRSVAEVVRYAIRRKLIEI
jgi:DNA-binding NarL/FixJ family response regulator